MMDYMNYNARKQAPAQPPAVEPTVDELAVTIRAAIEARRSGIQVEEGEMPDSLLSAFQPQLRAQIRRVK